MAVYAIGDVQGCFDELQHLLNKINFDRDADQLWFCGDLVNRGPKSLEVLRFVKGLGDRAVSVLGNHDLHFLAVAGGCGKKLKHDTLTPILEADDAEELINWLRCLPLMHCDEALGYSMIHAGLPVQWSIMTARSYARELEAVLRDSDYMSFIKKMYGDQPDRWSDDLAGIDRLRFITNAFTRTRYCTAAGVLNFSDKGGLGSQHEDVLPWFDVPGRRSADDKIVFGHWSTLEVGEYNNAIAIDSGCLWGGQLTAVRLDSDCLQWFKVECQAACAPEQA